MNYKLTIKTADQYKAGTDSNIFLILEGENGQTEERRLNGYISGNAFERNNTDKLTLDFGADVGRIFRIKLRSDTMYAGSDWRVAYIEVKRDEDNDSFCNKTTRFNINEWIDDKKIHTYTVPYEDWAENIVSYETLVTEYKVYPVTVPSNGDYLFEQTETVSTEFSYTNTITKTSTFEFNQNLKLNGSYTQNAKAANNLKTTKNYTGYLEFAFKQGFTSSKVNSIVSSENQTLTKRAQAKLTNPEAKAKHYEAIFSIVKVNAIASTGGVVAMFSGNSSIEFSGFREVTE